MQMLYCTQISNFNYHNGLSFQTLKKNTCCEPDITKKTTEVKTFIPSFYGKDLVETEKQKRIKDIKESFPEGIEKATTKEIFKAIGIDCKEDKDGLLIISHYCAPDKDISYNDIGVKENDLFRDIKEIKEDADFKNSEVTNLGELRRIGGDANFNYSKIKTLGKIETIGRDAIFTNSQVEDLGELQSIGRDAFFSHFKIGSLGKVQKIGRDAFFNHSQIDDLGELQSVGRDAFLHNSQITSLCKLQSIGRNAYLHCTVITNLGKLQSIGRNVNIIRSLLKPSDFDNINIGGELVA